GSPPPGDGAAPATLIERQHPCRHLPDPRRSGDCSSPPRRACPGDGARPPHMRARSRSARRVQRLRAMRRLAYVLPLLLAAAPGCALYFGEEEDDGGSAGGGGGSGGGGGGGSVPDGSFEFVKTRSIAGEYPIVGIDA